MAGIKRCNKCGKELTTLNHYEGDMMRCEYDEATGSFVIVDHNYINLCEDCYFLGNEQKAIE